jgi:hypothetical protein
MTLVKHSKGEFIHSCHYGYKNHCNGVFQWGRDKLQIQHQQVRNYSQGTEPAGAGAGAGIVEKKRKHQGSREFCLSLQNKISVEGRPG